MDTGDTRRTVLVVEERRELTDCLDEWLGAEYEVLTAHSGEEAQALHDGHVSATFIDRDLEGSGVIELLDHILGQDFAGRLVSVSSSPGTAGTRPEFDDHFRKSVLLDGGRETVEHLVKQAVYEEEIHEWLTLLSKKATLEKEKESDELESSPEYDELVDEIEQLRIRAGTSRDDIPGERIDAIFREISRSPPG
jgi:CheY-like chemotaxis protein